LTDSIARLLVSETFLVTCVSLNDLYTKLAIMFEEYLHLL